MLPTSSYFLDGFGTVSLARSEQLGTCPTAAVTLQQQGRAEPGGEDLSHFITCRNLLLHLLLLLQLVSFWNSFQSRL